MTCVAALAEASHRLMMVEAIAGGLVAVGKVAMKLRKKPSVVKKLRRYHEKVQRIPLMGVEVLPLDLKILHHASEFREPYGLRVNDSLNASTSLTTAIEILATADRDFHRIPALTVAV